MLPAVANARPWAGVGKQAFGVCVLIVLVLHWLVFTLLTQRSGAVLSGAHPSIRPLLVRAIPANAHTRVAATGLMIESRSDAADQRLALKDGAAAETAQPEDANATPATDGGLQPKARQERFGQFDYVPREFLSLAPVPLSNIEIPFPESVAGEFNIKAQLTLFIDESGYVQRVRVDGPALPPLLEEAAVNVFRQARFALGQVGTQVVRSMIRIEVNFESQRFKSPLRTP